VRKLCRAKVPSLRQQEAAKKALEASGALASPIAGSAVPAATPASPTAPRIRGLSS